MCEKESSSGVGKRDWIRIPHWAVSAVALVLVCWVISAVIVGLICWGIYWLISAVGG
ncbi:MAG: hypothetical protein V1889_00930 [archaeon]